MKLFFTLFIIIIITMSLLSFFRKEKESKTKKNSPILGMVLLEESNSMDIKKVVAELRTKWKLDVDDKESTDEASVLVVEGYNIALANMSLPIPGDEVKTAAEYNYLWKNGKEEATKH
ncbi:MAG: hypothetical protein ACO1OF_06530 [Adhaeribacter sp.]